MINERILSFNKYLDTASRIIFFKKRRRIIPPVKKKIVYYFAFKRQFYLAILRTVKYQT